MRAAHAGTGTTPALRVQAGAQKEGVRCCPGTAQRAHTMPAGVGTKPAETFVFPQPNSGARSPPTPPVGLPLGTRGAELELEAGMAKSGRRGLRWGGCSTVRGCWGHDGEPGRAVPTRRAVVPGPCTTGTASPSTPAAVARWPLQSPAPQPWASGRG